MILDDSGQLKAVGTVRTRKKALMALVDYMGEKIPGWEAENDMVAIVHGDCLKDAQFVAEQVKERFHIPEVMINDINPSIGVHAGPGALGLLFSGQDGNRALQILQHLFYFRKNLKKNVR